MKSYKPGDKVIYGSNGICTIEDLRSLDDSGRVYYILKPSGNQSSTIFVPADNQTLVEKMRNIYTKQQIDAMIQSSRTHEVPWIDDKNERHAYFAEIMRGGIAEDLLMMIRRIYLRKKEVAKLGKRLSDIDNNALNQSETLVNEEFSYSLGIPPEEVAGYIRRELGGDFDE